MPDFFDEVDSSGVVEAHIQAVQRLEQAETVRVLEKYSAIRRELSIRLMNAKSDTFTAQKLRGVLAQVDGAISAMNDALAGELAPSAKRAAISGVKDLVGEIRTFDKMFTGAVTPIDLDAVLIGTQTEKLLINRMEASLSSYGEDVRAQVAQGLTNAVIVGDLSTGEMTDKVNKFFLGEEWKLSRIVRTELHNMYNLGKLAGMSDTQEEFLPDLKKTLIHPMDSRTGADSQLAARLNLIVDIDQPFTYNWHGKQRVFMAPPDRPNDRAILVPYRPAWGENRSSFVPVNSRINVI